MKKIIAIIAAIATISLLTAGVAQAKVKHHGIYVKTDKHHVLKSYRMPACDERNVFAKSQPCAWNFPDKHGRYMPNDPSFWIDAYGVSHYVWPSNPLTKWAKRQGWTWNFEKPHYCIQSTFGDLICPDGPHNPWDFIPSAE